MIKLTKRQLKILFYIFIGIITLIVGFQINKAVQRGAILAVCNEFVNTPTNYKKLPDEYINGTVPVPESVIEDLKNNIKTGYKNIFTDSAYEFYIVRDLDFIDYQASKKGMIIKSNCRITDYSEYKIRGNKAYILIEVLQEGSDYSKRDNVLRIIPYSAKVYYKVELYKINGKWLINRTDFYV